MEFVRQGAGCRAIWVIGQDLRRGRTSSKHGLRWPVPARRTALRCLNGQPGRPAQRALPANRNKAIRSVLIYCGWYNNRRLYSEHDVGRLRFLKRCRDLGFPLRDAKTLLDLSEQGGGDCQSVKEVAELHISDIRDKIIELKRLEAALCELTANCDSGNVSCPVLSRLRIA